MGCFKVIVPSWMRCKKSESRNIVVQPPSPTPPAVEDPEMRPTAGSTVRWGCFRMSEEQAERREKRKEIKKIRKLLKGFDRFNVSHRRRCMWKIQSWFDAVSYCDHEFDFQAPELFIDDPKDLLFYKCFVKGVDREKALQEYLKKVKPPRPTESIFLNPARPPTPEYEPSLEEEPLSPEEIELKRVQLNRFHSERSPESRAQWRLAKWFYDHRPVHVQDHYMPDHELPSWPGQFELEDMGRALGVPLPSTPSYCDELPSTTSSLIRSAIAEAFREDRMAYKGTPFEGLPEHLRNFDPFAEDDRPKIPTVVACAPVTVQKPFPLQLVSEPVPDTSGSVCAPECADVVPEANSDNNSEGAQVEETNGPVSDDAAPEVELEVTAGSVKVESEAETIEKSDEETVKGDSALPDAAAPVVVVENVTIEVCTKAAPEGKDVLDDLDDSSIIDALDMTIDTHEVLLQAKARLEEHEAAVRAAAEATASEEVATAEVVPASEEAPAVVRSEELPPPLPPKMKKRRVVHFDEDIKGGADPPGGSSAFVPRCFRNISWNFFKPLQPPRNPPGMVLRKFTD